MWRSLHDAWWRLATQHHPTSCPDRLTSSVLTAGSIVYQAGVAARNANYDRHPARQVRLPCAVISVGNLTVGGTGKTACVELVVRKLLARGRRVAVLSRGYGGPRRTYWLRADQGRLVCDGQPVGEAGVWADEPQLLARWLGGVPVVVGRRRDRTGRLACAKFGCDTIVLDDGFQHRQLHRDCDIVLVSARMPPGGWPVLPRGPMREPLESLRRAEMVVLTKADDDWTAANVLMERLRVLAPQAVSVVAAHEPMAIRSVPSGAVATPGSLAGQHVGLVSSIGDPQGFESTVQGLQASVLWHQVFPDHHPYRVNDWAMVLRQAQATRPDAILTTEKDWVRLAAVAHDRLPSTTPVKLVEVRLKIVRGEEEFDARLARVHAG